MAKQVETLKLAFIDGEGSASLLHLPGLLATPDVTIAGIATLPGTRNPIAQRLPDARDYADDFTGMIEKERPDLVYAIISPLRRYEIAAAVLKASCNLIVNKPPAITTEQIRQLDQIARKQGMTTGVVFYRRYSPLVRRAKALCEERGSVHSATATFYKNSIGREAYSQGGIDALTAARDTWKSTTRPWMDKRPVRQAYMTDLLMEMILMGRAVHAVPVDGGWLEIDAAGDLEVAEAMVADGTIRIAAVPRQDRPQTRHKS